MDERGRGVRLFINCDSEFQFLKYILCCPFRIEEDPDAVACIAVKLA